ncbi:MAG: hypothetical protein WD772_01395 [Pseudohongiellaceae bacterium]
MSGTNVQFLPFYDRFRSGESLGYPAKIGISTGAGLFYLLVQYLTLADKYAIVSQRCWILAVIISAALLALYIATDIFRRNLVLVEKLQGRQPISDEVINNWLTDRGYLICGFAFSMTTALVSYFLGVPEIFRQNLLSLFTIYGGYALAGFTSGMGVYGIVGIIVLFLKLSPCLHHSLDPMAADGAGGIKRLGDSLWFFAMLTGAIGLLASMYMFGISWTNMGESWARILFLIWLAFPYLVAISIVLIPGLAIRRNVQEFKQHKERELRQEHARVYTSLKNVVAENDSDIVARNRELTARLNKIQKQMAKLRAMRESHIDPKD